MANVSNIDCPTYNCQRIVYGPRLILFQEMLVGGTYLCFDRQDSIKYSYIVKGKIEPLINYGSFNDVEFWNTGDLIDFRNIPKEDRNKPRYVAIHDDGEQYCFASLGYEPTMTLHQLDGDVVIEPGICSLVLDGEFSLGNKVAKKFVMVLERDYPITLTGHGKILQIKF